MDTGNQRPSILVQDSCNNQSQAKEEQKSRPWISYCSELPRQNPRLSSLRKKELIWAHSVRGQSIMAGKVQRQECGQLVPRKPQSGGRAQWMLVVIYFTSAFFFKIYFSVSAHNIGLPPFRVGFSLQVTQSRIFPIVFKICLLSGSRFCQVGNPY